ncbi:MAG: alpha/beta hydrolase [Hyphomonadaceae bacterium]|nr:alpha/beta hydrolase [Hyphomonadaceae bacterium]
MKLSRRSLLSAAPALALGQAHAQNYAPARSETVDAGGERRRFRLLAPSTVQAAPIVLAFHGVDGSAESMARASHLDETARSEGWIMAYPEAIGRRWPYFSRSRTEGEVRFCDALISHLVDLGGDANRVHLTGMSGGGFFCNVVGARLSQRVASVAAHSGGAGFLERDGVNAAHKYPVLVIHGQDDAVVPVASGRALAALYRREGHHVEMLEYPRWGHAWAAPLGVNLRIADFFRRTPRN